MAPRFPIQDATDPNMQQMMQDTLGKMHHGSPPFQWVEDDDSSFIGCYAPLSHSTTPWARQFFELAKLCYSPNLGAAKPRNRELAILGLTSVLDMPYAVYCHRGVSEKVGLTSSQYEDGLAGRIPEGLSGEESMAYRLGRILTALNGPLDDETWQQVTSVMDKSEFVGILHTIAGYRWVALLEQVNGEDRRWIKKD